jgi:hypothetical protein
MAGKRGREASLKMRASREAWVDTAPSCPSASSRAAVGQPVSPFSGVPSPSGKSAEIDGLSTTGVSWPSFWASSWRASASHSAAASAFPAD